MLGKQTGTPSESGGPQDKGLPQGMLECRARRIGVADLVECLAKQPTHCKFSLSFGHSFFCRHPQRLEIAAHTAADRKVA